MLFVQKRNDLCKIELVKSISSTCNKDAYRQQLLLEMMELNKICFELYKGAWF